MSVPASPSRNGATTPSGSSSQLLEEIKGMMFSGRDFSTFLPSLSSPVSLFLSLNCASTGGGAWPSNDASHYQLLSRSSPAISIPPVAAISDILLGRQTVNLQLSTIPSQEGRCFSLVFATANAKPFTLDLLCASDNLRISWVYGITSLLKYCAVPYKLRPGKKTDGSSTPSSTTPRAITPRSVTPRSTTPAPATPKQAATPTAAAKQGEDQWEISVKCKFGKAYNPLVCLFVSDLQTQKFRYTDQTEKLMNSNNPTFKKRFTLPHTEPLPILKFSVYSVNSDVIHEEDRIGSADIRMGELVQGANMEFVYELGNKSGGAQGNMIILKATKQASKKATVLAAPSTPKAEAPQLLHKVTRMMVYGRTFIRYTDDLPPKETSLFYRDTNGGTLFWCDAGKRDEHPSRSLLLSQITDVSLGKQSTPFQRKNAESAPEDHCFSIHSPNITLALEASTVKQCVAWGFGIMSLLKSSGSAAGSRVGSRSVSRAGSRAASRGSSPAASGRSTPVPVQVGRGEMVAPGGTSPRKITQNYAGTNGLSSSPTQTQPAEPYKTIAPSPSVSESSSYKAPPPKSVQPEAAARSSAAPAPSPVESAPPARAPPAVPPTFTPPVFTGPPAVLHAKSMLADGSTFVIHPTKQSYTVWYHELPGDRVGALQFNQGLSKDISTAISVPLTSILSLSLGRQSPGFWSTAWEDAPGHECFFSLTLEGNSWDIETKTPKTRQIWSDAVQFIIKEMTGRVLEVVPIPKTTDVYMRGDSIFSYPAFPPSPTPSTVFVFVAQRDNQSGMIVSAHPTDLIRNTSTPLFSTPFTVQLFTRRSLQDVIFELYQYPNHAIPALSELRQEKNKMGYAEIAVNRLVENEKQSPGSELYLPLVTPGDLSLKLMLSQNQTKIIITTRKPDMYVFNQQEVAFISPSKKPEKVVEDTPAATSYSSVPAPADTAPAAAAVVPVEVEAPAPVKSAAPAEPEKSASVEEKYDTRDDLVTSKNVQDSPVAHPPSLHIPTGSVDFSQVNLHSIPHMASPSNADFLSPNFSPSPATSPNAYIIQPGDYVKVILSVRAHGLFLAKDGMLESLVGVFHVDPARCKFDFVHHTDRIIDSTSPSYNRALQLLHVGGSPSLYVASVYDIHTTRKARESCRLGSAWFFLDQHLNEPDKEFCYYLSHSNSLLYHQKLVDNRACLYVKTLDIIKINAEEKDKLSHHRMDNLNVTSPVTPMTAYPRTPQTYPGTPLRAFDTQGGGATPFGSQTPMSVAGQQPRPLQLAPNAVNPPPSTIKTAKPADMNSRSSGNLSSEFNLAASPVSSSSPHQPGASPVASTPAPAPAPYTPAPVPVTSLSSPAPVPQPAPQPVQAKAVLPAVTETEEVPPSAILFGSNIAGTLAHQKMHGAFSPDLDAELPLLVPTLMRNIVDNRGHRTEGIFRVSPPSDQIDDGATLLESGEYQIEATNPHLSAALLKLWLRSLSEPIIPFKLYNYCVDIGKSTSFSLQHEDSIWKLKSIINLLDSPSKKTLATLLLFVRALLAFTGATRMTANAYSVVLAPGLLRSQDTDPMVLMRDAKPANKFIEYLIDAAEVVLGPEENQAANVVLGFLFEEEDERIIQDYVRSLPALPRPVRPLLTIDQLPQLSGAPPTLPYSSSNTTRPQTVIPLTAPKVLSQSAPLPQSAAPAPAPVAAAPIQPQSVPIATPAAAPSSDDPYAVPPVSITTIDSLPRAEQLVEMHRYLVSMMVNGVIMKKYAISTGKPEKKLVFYHAPNSQNSSIQVYPLVAAEHKAGMICWCPEPKKNMQLMKSIPITSIRKIIDGKTDSKTWGLPDAQDAVTSCCLTIVTKERTLDLEAQSPRQKLEWIYGIRLMLGTIGRGPVPSLVPLLKPVKPSGSPSTGPAASPAPTFNTPAASQAATNYAAAAATPVPISDELAGSVLSTAQNFLQYLYSSSAHSFQAVPCQVWYNAYDRAVKWKEASKDDINTFLLSSIRDVIGGNSAAAFQQKGNTSVAANCFSVMVSSPGANGVETIKMLNFEADNAAIKEQWTAELKRLIGK